MFFLLLLLFLRWSQVKMEEMSFQLLLENCQGFSIPDRGEKCIPPARNGEWERSGERFCASLWWHQEALLTRSSQTSGGDVDCHQWVEVGGCWACSICKHLCLELDASCNREPVQGDREVWHGPFWVRWRPIVPLHSESSVKVWLCLMEVQLEEHCSSPV